MNPLTPLQQQKAFEHISKRKRKKRRKRKTPKTSSSRAVRTQNSGYSSTGPSWYDYSGGVMSSVARGSSILLGIHWLLQHSANSVWDCAYSRSYGVKVATFNPKRWRTRAVLPSMLAGFAGYDAPCAVFLSFVDVRGDSTGAVLGQGVHACCHWSGADGQTAQQTVEIHQLQFLDKFVQISCRCAEAVSQGPDCLSDQRVSPVAGHSDRLPCCAGRAASRAWSRRAENCGDSHRCSSWSRCTCPFLVRLVPFASQRRQRCSSSNVVDFPFVP